MRAQVGHMKDDRWTRAQLAGFQHFPDWDDYASSEVWIGRPQRIEQETILARSGFPDTIRIHCTFCDNEVSASVAWGANADDPPNWRESTTCPKCGLINRVRFCIELTKKLLAGNRKPDIYATEQATLAFARLRELYPSLVGSEFIGADKDKRLRLQTYLMDLTGDPTIKLRHEDVTQLDLGDCTMDAVISMEVLEHVPEFQYALGEFCRVLRPGGALILSVPFIENSPVSLVRARLTDEGVEHLLPPEYHGDPTQDAGCLAFHTFGWKLLEEIRASGFSGAWLVDGWNPEKGYLGFTGCLYAIK